MKRSVKTSALLNGTIGGLTAGVFVLDLLTPHLAAEAERSATTQWMKWLL
jgi:hypothetical protein